MGSWKHRQKLGLCERNMVHRLVTVLWCYGACNTLASQESCNDIKEYTDEHSSNCLQELPNISSLQSWAEKIQNQHKFIHKNDPNILYEREENIGADLQPHKHVAGVTVAPLQGQAI